MALEKLWKDRKRHFGLPISFTKYSMSDDRLFIETGFFNIHQEEVLLYRVRDICLHRSLGQRLFGVGTVELQTSDKTSPVVSLKNIAHAEEVKEMIHEHVEQMKIARRMHLGEILDDADDDGDDDAMFMDEEHQ